MNTFFNIFKRVLSIFMVLIFSVISLGLEKHNIAFATESSIESAIQWAINIANDDSHGYSQSNRWGPDYDCSSLVISALKQAGFDVGEATYTGNMRSNLTKRGFDWISWNELGGSSNLQRGDILLNETYHTELYIGNNKLVGANSSRGYSESGDQTGTEVFVKDYFMYSHGWDGVLRYKMANSVAPSWASIDILNERDYVFNTNEMIHFHGSSDVNASYWIGIDKDGNRVMTHEMPDGDFSISFTEPGIYSAYVTASNSAGYSDSAFYEFRIMAPADLGDEREIYIENRGTGRLLTVDDTADASVTQNVYGAKKSDSEKQLWRLKKQSDGSYKIILVKNGACLEAFQAGTDSGTNISAYQETDSYINQKFYFYRYNDFYYIKPICSDLFVDMGSEDPYNVATYGYAEDWDPQMFKVTDVTYAPVWADIMTVDYRMNYNVNETIEFLMDSDTATEYYVNIDRDLKRLVSEKTTTQKFSISFSEPGWYTACVTARNSTGWVDSEYIGFRVLAPADLGNEEIVYIENQASHLLLSVENSPSEGTSNVFGGNRSSTYNQKWKMKKQKNGTYSFTLDNDGRCLEVFSGGTTNGTNISVYEETEDFVNQYFYIYRLYDAYYIKPVCSDLFVDMAYDDTNNVATYGYADNWEHQKFNIIPVSDYYAENDVNGDAEFNVLDIISLSKWILVIPDSSLASTEAADQNNDGVIDVYDLALLKRKLISNK